MNTKSISKITIAEITERADIGRGTFYSHYPDIYALYAEVEAEMFAQFDRFYDESFPIRDRHDILRFIEKTTDYIYRNRTLFHLLTDPANTLLTSGKFKLFFKSKILQEMAGSTGDAAPRTPSAFEETESLFIASGVIGVIEDWIERGMEEPTEMGLRLQQLLLKLEE